VIEPIATKADLHRLEAAINRIEADLRAERFDAECKQIANRITLKFAVMLVVGAAVFIVAMHLWPPHP
jgi:hypothetical protein